MIRLKVGAANLQEALGHLADVSERNAGIQEKLASLQQERNSRLGLAERFARGSGEDIGKLNRGIVLANKANNDAKAFDKFSPADRNLVLDFLDSAGGASLTGLRGAPRADDLKNRLLSDFNGGAFKLTPAQQAEERGLQDAAKAAYDAGVEAAKQLVASRRRLRKVFLRG